VQRHPQQQQQQRQQQLRPRRGSRLPQQLQAPSRRHSRQQPRQLRHR
jgi:hypothetical protein